VVLAPVYASSMPDPIAAARESVRGTLERTIVALHRVIEANEMLAKFPGHEESAAERIAEGYVELERAEEELRRLDDDRWPYTGVPAE
jgi:hypothetical protein